MAHLRKGVVVLSFGLLSSAAIADHAPKYEFCARNDKKVQMSDADMDDVLARATAILAVTTQGKATSHCSNVALVRNVPVKPYDGSELPETLASSASFAKLTAVPCVKVVQRITWCGGWPLVKGYAVGCSPIPGKVMIVVRKDPTQSDSYDHALEPVLWLHEFGHNRGLYHNMHDQHDVMSPDPYPNSTKLSPQECSAYGSSTAARYTQNAGVGAAAPILPAESGLPKPQVMETVGLEEFVKRPFGKADFGAASRFSGQLPAAQKLLFEPSLIAYRPNIVGLLGVIGTPETIAPLTILIRTPVTGSAAGADAISRFAALTAIGTIANRFKLPDQSVSILRQGMNPGFWSEYVETSTKNNQSRLDEQDVRSLINDLTVHAIQSYALTGSPAAFEFLKELKESPRIATLPTDKSIELHQALDDALKLNMQSREKGALELLQ